MYRMKQKYTITKKISKHGEQAVIVIPKLLQDILKPGSIAEISITLLNKKSSESTR